MRIIVFPGPDGRISSGTKIVGHSIPETATMIEIERTEIDPHEVVLLRNGNLESVFDYCGSGPWFDQKAATADRLKPHEITEIGIVPPNDYGHPVTSGWENMAMTPRPETPAEKKAREKAEAEAASAKEKERRAARELSPVQIRLAANQMGVRDAIEALVANPATPAAVRDYWEYSTVFRRSSSIWAQVIPLLNATEADVDQLYDIGEPL